MRTWKELQFEVNNNTTNEVRYELSKLKLSGWEERDNLKTTRFIIWTTKESLLKHLKQLPFIIDNSLRQKNTKPKNWNIAWKQFFKPIKVGKTLHILPSWEKPKVKKPGITIHIKPGMAFGTGDHPTTQLCLEALEKSVNRGERWLDFGTGSGILAIAAAKLGARDVIAIDEDAMAIELARENVRLNKVSRIIDLRRGSTLPSKRFDGIVANILAEPLITMAEALLKHVKPSGTLILSGIHKAKAASVKRAYRNLCTKVTELGAKKDWVCLLVKI